MRRFRLFLGQCVDNRRQIFFIILSPYAFLSTPLHYQKNFFLFTGDSIIHLFFYLGKHKAVTRSRNYPEPELPGAGTIPGAELFLAGAETELLDRLWLRL